MGKDTALPSAVDLQTVAMKIPPGRYHIAQWITYATLTKEVFRRFPLTNPVLNAPFTLKPGTVLHLGRFVIDGGTSARYPVITLQWSVRPLPVKQNEARAAFALHYPKLSELPFDCVLCLD